MKTRNQAGFTLIELMIVTVILGFLMVAIGGIFKSQLEASLSNMDEADTQAAVQTVSNMIATDIIMAGYGALPGVPVFTLTTVAGVDTLTIASASQSGNSIGTFIVSGGNLFNGSILPLRCFGRDGDGIQDVAPFLGETADYYRDVMFTTLTPTSLLFVNPFTGVPLTSISPNPIAVVDNPAQLAAGGRCQNSGVDLNGDGVSEPVVNVAVAAAVTVPKGTAVYGIRGGGQTTYQVNVSTATLSQNGMPLLVGAEDLQFRFFGTTVCNAGCDSLVGIDPRAITQVAVGIVVRNQRRDPLGIGDPEAVRTTFDHALVITPEMSQFSRRQFTFTVRPKNNAL